MNKDCSIDYSKIKNPRLLRRILCKKREKVFTRTPYKSESMKKRNAGIPVVPSTKKIVTPSLVKAQRGPPKIVKVVE